MQTMTRVMMVAMTTVMTLGAGPAVAAEGEGSLDKGLIRTVVQTNIEQIRECYNAALVRDEQAQGRVVIDFTIGAGGSVVAAAVAESDMADALAPACIRDAIASWTFPAPTGGVVEVSYPFVLEPG